jgi:hypothetical protein
LSPKKKLAAQQPHYQEYPVEERNLELYDTLWEKRL